MTWSNMAVVAEILSSIAVFVTLVYLAIQTRQNAQATQANGRQMTATTDVQLCLHQAAHASVFAKAHEPNLTDEQKAYFDGYLAASLRLRELDWMNYKAGVLDEATWQSYRSSLAMVFSVPSFRTYWKNIRMHLDPGFGSSVDEVVDETPVTNENPALALFDK